MHLPLPERSSYALKKEHAWDDLVADLADCRTLIALENCRQEWLTKMARDRWSSPLAWGAMQEFAACKQQIIEAMSVEELVMVPLMDALEASLKMETKKETDNGTTEE